MEIRRDFLEYGAFFHIYNRGINGCDVFINSQNKLFFLQKVKQYLSEIVDIYAYCLMNNHFHFIVRVKSEEEIVGNKNFAKVFGVAVSNFGEVKKGIHADYSLASKQLGKLISSYTQAFNKVNNRHGSLFERPFKRKRIKDEEYLRRSIIYVHRNPIDISEKYEDYSYSSYKTILSEKPTLVKRNEVLEYFGGKENFIFMHNKEVEL